MPSRLSPQWLCGNSCTWAHDVRFHIAGTNEPKSAQQASNITLLALLVEHSLVHWYQQCGTVHHVPKCMSCHNAIVVITGRAHCFHDYIYITLILLLWDLSTLCVVDHLWPLILRSLLCLLSTLWFIGTSNVEPYIMCPSAWVATKPLWW